MQATHIWHKFHLHRRKAIIVWSLVVVLPAIAQNKPTTNLINYENQWIHYGFLMGVHTSKYVIKYSEDFVSPSQDTVYSIIPSNLGGFKLGFIANIKLAMYLDFRGSVTIGFYENDLLYQFTNNTNLRELRDASVVEIPLLLKYKSARRGNIAAYLIGGINPSFEASGKSSREEVTEKLELNTWNVAFEIGGGFDLYNPFFKFSPEIRYSYGLINRLTENVNAYNTGLNRLTTQNLTVYLTFEGGPTPKKKRGGKTKGAGQHKAKKRRYKPLKRFRARNS